MPQSSNRRPTAPDPLHEAIVRLGAARKLTDHILSGRWPASLANVTHIAELVDQAKSLLWASAWCGKEVA